MRQLISTAQCLPSVDEIVSKIGRQTIQRSSDLGMRHVQDMIVAPTSDHSTIFNDRTREAFLRMFYTQFAEYLIGLYAVTCVVVHPSISRGVTVCIRETSPEYLPVLLPRVPAVLSNRFSVMDAETSTPFNFAFSDFIRCTPGIDKADVVTAAFTAVTRIMNSAFAKDAATA